VSCMRMARLDINRYVPHGRLQLVLIPFIHRQKFVRLLITPLFSRNSPPTDAIMIRKHLQFISNHKSWHDGRAIEPATRARHHKMISPEGLGRCTPRARLGNCDAPCGSAVSVRALIGDTVNRMSRIRNVHEEEIITEGNKFRRGLKFEKAR
jgi:hypothetical protein